MQVARQIVHRSFPNETVVLDLETGRYHSLNHTGGRMLEMLEEVGSVKEAAAKLAVEFDVALKDIQADLCRFCAALRQRGLIELAEPLA